MEICPAGILAVIICTYILLCKKQSFFLMVLFSTVLDIFVERGFLLKVGTSQLSISNLPFFIVVIYSLQYLKNIPYAIMIRWIQMVCSFCIPIIILILIPTDVLTACPPIQWDNIIFEGVSPVHPTVNSLVIIVTIKCILYSLTFLVIYTHWELKDYKKYLEKISKISCFFVYLSIIEFIIKNVFKFSEQWGVLMENFWGKTIFTVMAGRVRGLFIETCLFTKESSHFVYSLFFVCLIRLTDNIVKQKKHKIDYVIILCFVMMLLSTSFTSVLMIFSFLSIYFVYRLYILQSNGIFLRNVFILVAICFIASLVAIQGNIISDRFYNLLDNFNNFFTFEIGHIEHNMYGDGSTYIRILSVMQTFKIFFERPFFGFSIMSVDCHGSTPLFLASVGIVGLICWIRFYFYSIPLKKMIKPKSLPYFFCIAFYLFCNLFAGVGVTPFSFFIPLIISICYCIICSKNEN